MNMTNLSASLGSTNASGNISVSNFQAPHLTFALSADKLNVTELEQIADGRHRRRRRTKEAQKLRGACSHGGCRARAAARLSADRNRHRHLGGRDHHLRTDGADRTLSPTST